MWTRIAFITRYSSTTFEEAMELGIEHAEPFMRALAKLINEENTPRK